MFVSLVVCPSLFLGGLLAQEAESQPDRLKLLYAELQERSDAQRDSGIFVIDDQQMIIDGTDETVPVGGAALQEFDLGKGLVSLRLADGRRLLAAEFSALGLASTRHKVTLELNQSPVTFDSGQVNAPRTNGDLQIVATINRGLLERVVVKEFLISEGEGRYRFQSRGSVQHDSASVFDRACNPSGRVCAEIGEGVLRFLADLAPGPLEFSSAWVEAPGDLAISIQEAVHEGNCLTDLLGHNEPGCNANDAVFPDLTTVTAVDGDVCESEADTIQLEITANVSATASSRYDVSLWVGLEGQSPQFSGQCAAFVHDTTSPFENLELGDPADTCGDISQDINSPIVENQVVTVKCLDDDENDKLNVFLCTAWDNNQTGTCTLDNPFGALPGTSSKCTCPEDPFEVDIPVADAVIHVEKDLLPATDNSDTFDLTFTSTDLVVVDNSPATGHLWEVGGETYVGDGGTDKGLLFLGAAQNSAQVSLVEVGNTGVDLDNYTRTLECSVETEAGLVPIAVTDDTVTVNDGEVVRCKWTNTRKASLTITKETNPDAAEGTFDYVADWNSESDGDSTTLGDGDSFGEALLEAGLWYVTSETVPEDWQLVDISCARTTDSSAETDSSVQFSADGTQGSFGDAFASGDRFVRVNLAPGDAIRCVYENRQKAKITVKKDLVPDTDDGTFVLRVDEGNTNHATSAAVGDGGMVMATNLDPTLTYTVSESGAGEGDQATDLGDYNSEVECTRPNTDDPENPIVVASAENTQVDVDVEPGDDVTCTFTNTRRTGKLKLVKALDPVDDSGLFDLIIEGSDGALRSPVKTTRAMMAW